METSQENPKFLENILLLEILLSDLLASLTENIYLRKVLPQIFLTNPCIF